ncbi:MAG TPA: SDR family NAD(P)-dependent oxidoreductase [Chthoniobacterales bacterium]|nr:SDR family NAD(P)-dependent oxidoreductase [Chthoniobacterales bacterium]
MKRYLITGASRGIGRAIAEKLAAPGHALLLHGRDHDALAETCRRVEIKSSQAIPLCYDLRNPASIQKMVDEIGPDPLEALINNAGIASVKPLREITLDEWQATFAVNVTAPFLLTQKLLPLMSAGSTVVNILSIAAKTGFPNWGTYCMSKFALEGFSQAVREEVRPRGIRVLNVYPAATNTEIWSGVEGDWPREKMLVPEEIAHAVAYALSRPADVGVENIMVQNVSGAL